MSKLIVEMEMPKSCEFCHMANWNKLNELTGCDAVSGKRNVPDNDEFWNKGRPSWCPIKGVLPEEHGDLIDRSELIKHDHQHYEYLSDEYYVTVWDIKAAPTIVPTTERSEHGTTVD